MPEIIAAVVGAVVTGILGLGVYLYRQHRGNEVIVQRLSQSPQIKFSDAIQKKLEIIYNGRKVNNLVLTQFVIFNKGDKIIKPLKLTVNVSPKSENFTYAELNVSDPQEITTAKMDSGTGAFEIERPYLNPQKKYKEEKIGVSVFSDVLLDFSVNGGGEDWGCKLVSNSMEKRRGFSIIYITAIFIVMGVSIILFDKPDINLSTNQYIWLNMGYIVLAVLGIIVTSKNFIFGD